MNLSGHCLCGEVSVTVEGEPVAQLYCHCHSCQKASSAPLIAAALFPAENVIAEGNIKTFSVTDKPGAAVRHVCASCGTRVMNTPKGSPQLRAILPPVFESEDWFKPTMHIFYADRRVDIDDNLPKYLDLPAAFGGSDKTA